MAATLLADTLPAAHRQGIAVIGCIGIAYSVLVLEKEVRLRRLLCERRPAANAHPETVGTRRWHAQPAAPHPQPNKPPHTSPPFLTLTRASLLQPETLALPGGSFVTLLLATAVGRSALTARGTPSALMLAVFLVLELGYVVAVMFAIVQISLEGPVRAPGIASAVGPAHWLSEAPDSSCSAFAAANSVRRNRRKL